MDFLDDEQYLLETEMGRELYDTISGLPILDPHSHIDVKEIVENDNYSDIWEIEAATDHYVWTLMRKRGVDEECITGDAPNQEKWRELATIFPEVAGNPTYEWMHLDLRRRFGINQIISESTADEIWEETAAQLEHKELKPQSLLREMNVQVLCSTDNPTDTLEYHDRAKQEVQGVDILPTWRADRALMIDHQDWYEFVNDLAEVTKSNTDDFDGYLDALAMTHDYFDNHGCRASDLGTQSAVSYSVNKARAKYVFEKAITGKSIKPEESDDFKAYLLEYIGELNTEKGWVSQLHIGAVRDYRAELYERLGPDTGGDVSTQIIDITGNLKYFVNTFDGEHEIVLYCVDPSHYPSIATISRVFPNVSVGAAWWFNDSPYMMGHQLEYVSTVDVLSNYGGMVSDSRKLLSLGSRVEIFRRSLANMVGHQVKRGQIPSDVAVDLARCVAHDRPKELFGF